jgi:hypothetical protein
VPAEEGRVVPTRQANQLCAGRSLSSADGRPGERRLILIADDNEQRALHTARVAAGSVPPEEQRRTRCHCLLPVRILIRPQRSVGVLGVGRREQRDGPRRADERHQQRPAPDETTEHVENSPAEEAQHGHRLLVTGRVAGRGRTVGVRCLRDRRGKLRVARRDAEDVTARGGEAPDRQPGRVDSGQRPGEVDRRLPVVELVADPRDLARLPAALAHTAVVESDDAEPGIVEPLGELVGARLLGHREPAGHDHARAVGSRIVPRGALGIATDESNLLPLDRHPDLRNGLDLLFSKVNHAVRKLSTG